MKFNIVYAILIIKLLVFMFNVWLIIFQHNFIIVMMIMGIKFIVQIQIVKCLNVYMKMNNKLMEHFV